MESQIFRDISTELDLNGPYLAFSTQPSDQSTTNGGSISYTGIATNSYGISGSPENIGTLTYQWYETGVGALTDGGVISGATTNVLTFSSVVFLGCFPVLTAYCSAGSPNESKPIG